MLFFGHTPVDQLLESVKLHLRRMLELFELSTCFAYHFNCFHKSFHTFPHICHRLCELVVKSASE